MGRRPLAIFALLPLGFSASLHAELAGPVTDGDTLAVAGQTIRLFGIDASESKQTCSPRAPSRPCRATPLARSDGATRACQSAVVRLMAAIETYGLSRKA